MTHPILISGSMAYDHIMVFPDHFKNHILPDKVHMLSVSFLVPEMRREFGGTAGNIAYNLGLLEADPLIIAAVGDDFGSYRARLEELKLRQEGIRTIPGTYTGQAFITTDLDDNQITAFHPGAMNYSHQANMPLGGQPRLGIISPAGKLGMQCHALSMKEAGVAFVFDPGQAMPLFDGAELLDLIEIADYVTVNDYEAELLQERTGLSLERLAGMVQALIVTLGGEGSRILHHGQETRVPAVPAAALKDPTGCGDAYRAGLLYGLQQGWDWLKIGRLASLLGAIKIASQGGQNHFFTRSELAARYSQHFGEPLWD